MWLSYENFEKNLPEVRPANCERNSIMVEIASETESYLNRNETDSDSVSVLFLLVQQSHINKKLKKGFANKVYDGRMKAR